MVLLMIVRELLLMVTLIDWKIMMIMMEQRNDDLCNIEDIMSMVNIEEMDME